MENKDFIQENKFLVLDRLKCLRGDYYHNKCSLCIEACPDNAIDLFRDKLTIDDSCTNCGVCVGLCPSESLHLENFDENSYSVEFEHKSENKLSCKGDSACLAVYDAHHLITMAYRHKDSLECDLSHCDSCSINKENNVKSNISYNIESSNKFLASISNKKIEIISEKSEVEASRRGLFSKVFKTTQTLKEDKNLTQKINENIINSKVPTKRQILQNTLKRIDDLETKSLNDEFNFIVNKTIDYSTCTNCKECLQFCPTEALLNNTDQSSILFASGKCINCNICNDICKENSITTSYVGIDLLDFAFTRAKSLIDFKLEICTECKCSFAYKDGDMICNRCKKFKTSTYEDMFKMASEM
jgi:Pyruvate/2-oxoacid:ferredoxin oxidoreductase delta subunit